MSTNDLVVLESILTDAHANSSSGISIDEFFELFTLEQVLKDFELSYDELKSGHVDGGNDGGLDGFFTFVNGELVQEDFSFESVKKNPILDLHLIQSKQTPSFSEIAINNVIVSVGSLFDLQKPLSELQSTYNAPVMQQCKLFRAAYIALAAKHPTLRVQVSFATKGDTAAIHPKVNEKAKVLVEGLEKCFAGGEVVARFLGASELLEATRTETTYTLQLNFTESYISRDVYSYIMLSKLSDYYRFIADDEGKLRKYIFESNVRDYQGEVEVNREIRDTLVSGDKMDFWWLNNGVTILASKASIVGKSISLDDVQVVNGLQTTETIYNYLKAKGGGAEDERAVLVKIVVTENAEARDRIIKATNYQTPITAASLRATDRIQRNIEDYLKQADYYYDRRKNFYKNAGKSPQRIISIPYLAQAVMAIILREPDNSRARPSSLIKRPSDYARVFSENTPMGSYLFCLRLMKLVEDFVGSVDQDERWGANNLRFHIAMWSAMELMGSSDYSASDLSEIDVDSVISEEELGEAFRNVWESAEISLEVYEDFERMCKNRGFVEDLIKSFQELKDQELKDMGSEP